MGHMKDVAERIHCKNIVLGFGGDCNLSPEQAEECTQVRYAEPNIKQNWCVQHANHRLSGDVISFAKELTHVHSTYQ